MSSPRRAGLSAMVIVSGFLHVRPAFRAAYLERCRAVVERARLSAGCLDFALSADLLDPGRVNVLERWSCPEAVEDFRGEGPPDELSAMLLGAEVGQFAVTAAGQLAGAGELA
jgi:quinol monooxygenase YgiN